VPATQRYCVGNFVTWDPKITTFPGLYVIGAAYAWAAHLALQWAGVALVSCAAATGAMGRAH
jgi:alpha-1,2-glucosyltransferase